MHQTKGDRGTNPAAIRCRAMSRRVLIVEDDPLNGLLFCELLEGDGFTVELVADERDAVAAAREFAPDLIIMDIHLPHVSGLSLIRMLKKDTALAPIPVLAVTGYVGKGEEIRVLRAGASGYLAKPISIQPFLAAVAGLLPSSGDPALGATPGAEGS